MRAAVTDIEGGLVLTDLPEGPLHPGEVRIGVAFCGICGSDLHYRTVLPPGTVLGHEFSGRVVEMADDVRGWRVGDRVAVLPYRACGVCEACSSGREQICERRLHVIGGSFGAGAYAQRVVAHESMLLPLPDELSDQHAALVEPLAVALHALSVVSVARGAPVAIVGGGTIGFMVALALKAEGIDRLWVVEPRRDRRALLQRAGVSAVDSIGALQSVPQALGARPQVIFECAGHAAALAECVEMAAPAAHLVLVSASQLSTALPQAKMMMKELRLSSVMFYSRHEFARAIELLSCGAVPGDALQTTVVPLERAPDAMLDLLRQDTLHFKVLLKP